MFGPKEWHPKHSPSAIPNLPSVKWDCSFSAGILGLSAEHSRSRLLMCQVHPQTSPLDLAFRLNASMLRRTRLPGFRSLEVPLILLANHWTNRRYDLAFCGENKRSAKSLTQCLRQRSATETPASCSFTIPMICSSEKRLRFMPWSLSWAGTNFKLNYARQGQRSRGSSIYAAPSLLGMVRQEKLRAIASYSVEKFGFAGFAKIKTHCASARLQTESLSIFECRAKGSNC